MIHLEVYQVINKVQIVVELFLVILLKCIRKMIAKLLILYRFLIKCRLVKEVYHQE